MGQEATTNTYEGHVFYFTIHTPSKPHRDRNRLAKANSADKKRAVKGREIARFKMTVDQVWLSMSYSVY